MEGEHPEHTKNTHIYWQIAAILFLVAGAGATWYFWDLSEKQAALIATQDATIEAQHTELTLTTNRVNDLESTLNQVREELEELEDDYRDEKNKNDDFEDQIKKITGTVRDLDKLSKTDEELLQKYSKVYFLNENYVPSDLDKIPSKYVLADRDTQYFHGDALKFLEDMLDDAEDDGIDLKIISAYRSFDEQTALKGQYTTTYGSGANAFSADQGYSEHQLGTTVDLTVESVGGAYTSFAETDAYKWLLKNAHKYGFTLSYPENNSFYIFEPWHWRFVGEDLAGDLKDKNDHFYDWDQREIDQYLIKIFD